MSKVVLIVEDDPDMRSICADALVSRGYQVLLATQGAEGVTLARTRRPDLILLDIRMPIMDGWSALEYLKSYQETRGIPIFALSGSLLSSGTERPEDLGFDRLLAKPLNPSALVREVEDRIGPPE